jgi:hypothetical protein
MGLFAAVHHESMRRQGCAKAFPSVTAGLLGTDGERFWKLPWGF